MSGNVRKAGPVGVDGDESFVLAHAPDLDEAEGWSVTVRPYRPRPAHDLLEDFSSSASGCGCECLLAGNRVSMADGSSLPIELVRAGDRVQTMSGPASVRRVEETRLGMTRKLIELRGIGDECLILSDDHPLWVSRRSAGGTALESWGTYNLNHVLYQMRNVPGYALAQPPVPLNFDLPEQIAHVSGWLHCRPIYHHLSPDTPLYHLVVDNAFSFIAEGFAVFSHCSASQGPATPWAGLTRSDAAQRFLANLSETA